METIVASGPGREWGRGCSDCPPLLDEWELQVLSGEGKVGGVDAFLEEERSTQARCSRRYTSPCPTSTPLPPLPGCSYHLGCLLPPSPPGGISPAYGATSWLVPCKPMPACRSLGCECPRGPAQGLESHREDFGFPSEGGGSPGKFRAGKGP